MLPIVFKIIFNVIQEAQTHILFDGTATMHFHSGTRLASEKVKYSICQSMSMIEISDFIHSLREFYLQHRNLCSSLL
jgi:hypothetical protein